MDRRVRKAVLARLAAVEDMALRASATAAAARTQLRSITAGWRQLLAEHQPDRKGRCPLCSGWLRRRRWPCPVWATAHQHLIGDGSGALLRAGRKPNRFRQPRHVEVIPRQVNAGASADTTADPRTPDPRTAAHPSDHRSRDQRPDQRAHAPGAAIPAPAPARFASERIHRAPVSGSASHPGTTSHHRR